MQEILKISANDAHKAAISVCEQLLQYIDENNRYIENRNFKPMNIVGISRGGLFLAQYVAYALEKKWGLCKVRTYTEILRDKSRYISKDLIICDDILDTGKTFDKCVKEGFNNVFYCALFAKNIRVNDWLQSKKFFISSKHKIVDKGVWVKFPWD